MTVIKESKEALPKAVLFLKKGGVVICPTDTVYGFLADAQNKKAVDKIFTIKKRQRSKPLSLFIKDVSVAKKLAQIDLRQEAMLAKYWPGKYTFILNSKVKNQKSKPQLKSKKLYGVAKGTIALRIPEYDFLQKLLKKVNIPLAQTSVNLSGKNPIDKIETIIKVFGKSKVLIIDGGDIEKGIPSRIIDLTNDKLTRLR